MRTLEFDVQKQRLTKKSDCDFSGLVAGSQNYLEAKFNFSDEWNACTTKVASFWNNDEESAVFLNAENKCIIPDEALTSDKFYVSVIGVNSSYRIGTNRSKVKQEVI